VDTSHAGRGFFDLVAVRAGEVRFIEVKDGKRVPSERRLTPEEEQVHQRFQYAGAAVVVLESVEDARGLA
jgi:hypothetical protein